MMEDSGGGELHDTGKVFVFQILGGVQAAAGEDGVLNAGGQKVLEAYFQVEIVQFLQQAALCVISEVLQVVTVDLADGAAGLFHERPADVRFLCGTILPFQCRHDCGMVFLSQFPQVRCF